MLIKILYRDIKEFEQYILIKSFFFLFVLFFKEFHGPGTLIFSEFENFCCALVVLY